MDTEKQTEKISNFLSRGGAGVLAAVVIILVFLLCATWLKSLVFGILIASLLLPLEHFCEDFIFVKPERIGLIHRIRDRFSGKTRTPEEEKKLLRQQKIFKASLTSVLMVFLALILILSLAFFFLVPQAARAKRAIAEWSRNSPTVEKAERYLVGYRNGAEDGAVTAFRKQLRELAEENKETLASFAFSRGKDLLSIVYKFVKGLGFLLFDIVLSIFFGFYFLQKIAGFEGEGKLRRSRTGEWFVDMFFHSPWLPQVSRKTKWQTVKIITHIGAILSRWIRGYFTVIFIEMLLYTFSFAIAGVPYAFLAGIAAGLTVLLPFVGPILSFCLTVCLCIAFCEGNLFLTLIFVSVIYCLINGLLEQLFLYPVFIGGVSGLTTVETIIVVLVGGITAGITGMIFAVPAAAIIKYIIPFFYQATGQQNPVKN